MRLRAWAWLMRENGDKAWEDVQRCRELGGTPDAEILEAFGETADEQG